MSKIILQKVVGSEPQEFCRLAASLQQNTSNVVQVLDLSNNKLGVIIYPY